MKLFLVALFLIAGSHGTITDGFIHECFISPNVTLKLPPSPTMNASSYQLAWTNFTRTTFQASVWVPKSFNATNLVIEMISYRLRIALYKCSPTPTNSSWNLFATNVVNVSSFELRNYHTFRIVQNTTGQISTDMFFNSSRANSTSNEPSTSTNIFKLAIADGSILHLPPSSSATAATPPSNILFAPRSDEGMRNDSTGKIVYRNNIKLSWYRRLDNFDGNCFLDMALWVRRLPHDGIVTVWGLFTYYSKNSTSILNTTAEDTYTVIQKPASYMLSKYYFDRVSSNSTSATTTHDTTESKKNSTGSPPKFSNTTPDIPAWDMWRMRGSGNTTFIGVEITGATLVHVSYHMTVGNDTFDYGNLFENNVYVNSSNRFPEGSALCLFDWKGVGPKIV